jgi:hypothetical protein
VGGNPRLKAREPAALARLQAARQATVLARSLAGAELWIGHVRRLRPAMPWRGVEERVNAALPAGVPRFRPGRIARLARLYVREGLLEQAVLASAPRRRPAAGEGRRAVEIVAACLRGRPHLTLAALGDELLRLGVTPPRGGKAWAPSSLTALVARAREAGLLVRGEG